MPEPKPSEEEKKGLPDAVNKVLEDIKAGVEKMNKPAEETSKPSPTAPSWQDQREDYRKRLGFSEEQMRAHEEMSAKQNAPVIENLGWSHLEKKSDLATYRKEIEAELSIYPQERRDPGLMEKIYYYIKGKHADSKAPEKRDEKPVERVTRGPGYSGAETGLPAGGGEGGKGEEEQLTDVEKFLAAKFGTSEAAYAKAKKERRDFRGIKPASLEAKGMADLELNRLMRPR